MNEGRNEREGRRTSTRIYDDDDKKERGRKNYK